jgi:hypothetical protein
MKLKIRRKSCPVLFWKLKEISAGTCGESLTQRCSIAPTLSLSNRLLRLRLSTFSRTSSVSRRPTSNGFTTKGATEQSSGGRCLRTFFAFKLTRNQLRLCHFMHGTDRLSVAHRRVLLRGKVF